ncbi:MAG: hypothetical protein NT075_09240 [Chloroflexi bacterium]|nr:hypothetical protein [Chloroflexota bacterium]
MQKQYSLVYDPIFYIMLVIIALLATALPAGMGQPRFLPLIQTIGLFVFLLVPLRQRLVRPAIGVLCIWLLVQSLTLVGLVWLAPGQVEHAIGDGFIYHETYLQWFFAGGHPPDSLLVQPGNRLIELAGVLLGALASGGLIGIWFLVRAVNLTSYGIGGVMVALGGWQHFLAALPLWNLVRLAGYAGFIVLFAGPLLTSDWSLQYYRTKSRLLLVATLLLILGLGLEFILPGLWRSLFAPHILRQV